MTSKKSSTQKAVPSIKNKYQSPHVQISYVTTECAIAAGSVVSINMEVRVTEWEDREMDQIWNF